MFKLFTMMQKSHPFKRLKLHDNLKWKRFPKYVHSISSSEPFKILFLGRDEFSCLVLDQLFQRRDIWKEIVAATLPDRKVGRRGSQLSVSPLKVHCEKLCIPISLTPSEKVDFRYWELPPSFRSADTSNAVLVTASFGRLIPNNILHHFLPSRRLNVHPSLLPLYRGPAPIQHAIADDQKQTGVSIIEMKEKALGADIGEIWGQTRVDIRPGSTFLELRRLLAIEGGKLLTSVLSDMLTGKAIADPQNDFNATKAPLITRKSATIDFNTWDAAKVERMHRAIAHQKPLIAMLPASQTLQIHSPVPYPYEQSGAHVNSHLSKLTNPGDVIYHPETHSLIVRCANRTFISVPFVKQQDRNLLMAKEWWNGVPIQWLGDGILRFSGPDLPFSISHY